MTSKNIAQTRTRLLLALWDLGGTQQEVKKGQLSKRIVSKSQKVADYQVSFEELQNQGAIAISKGDFKFEGTIVGTWAADALLNM
ncbi:hypothetical protein A6V25_03020 [Nostoc sp. ATCC 53789]|nr:hypothetical protein A6V25_03020 [Nostoc sp. ATCC 53789]